MQKLANKVAVVTGGSTGIGLATAKRLASEGAYVFITGRRQAELDKAKAAIGPDVTMVQGDISTLEDLERLYKTVSSQKGGIDILVANAGMVEISDTANATPEHFDKTFDTNARGTFFTVQKAFPLLNDNAAIVVVSTVAAQKGFPSNVAYGASKAAVRSYVRAWAAELKGRNIRANAVSPGIIDTTILNAQFKTPEEVEGVKSYLASITPLGRIGKPEDVANAIFFLASPESSYITGVDIPVDGGFLDL
ncbi:SDR family NAD(P)-dependent oxidoreductase [Chitinophaga sp. sic0106]|uniref:SDR family NAD(P)-dependent oxidoreductase n=1 Tax=Chitinophaga sp. sic0106 TaxID=2854785 RepID=UPI001C4507E7|nr:SDR family oxidoreductase [Chitinophaga sp. sic0106]MBV7533033.1 SDR family oxidoreductase [Chitinophaga sp. sic0106]